MFPHGPQSLSTPLQLLSSPSAQVLLGPRMNGRIGAVAVRGKAGHSLVCALAAPIRAQSRVTARVRVVVVVVVCEAQLEGVAVLVGVVPDDLGGTGVDVRIVVVAIGCRTRRVPQALRSWPPARSPSSSVRTRRHPGPRTRIPVTEGIGVVVEPVAIVVDGIVVTELVRSGIDVRVAVVAVGRG